MYKGRMLTPEEFWARMTEQDAQLRDSFAARVTYGLDGWPASVTLAEWALGDGTMRSLRYDDGPEVTVVVAAASGEDVVDHLLMNLPGPRDLRLDTSTPRPEHRQPTAADPATISVQGAPVLFTGWRSGGFLVLGAAANGVDLAVCVRGIDPARLRITTIGDIEPYLDGRRELIRSARRKHGFDE
jgi:hypothetical protein